MNSEMVKYKKVKIGNFRFKYTHSCKLNFKPKEIKRKKIEEDCFEGEAAAKKLVLSSIHFLLREA